MFGLLSEATHLPASDTPMQGSCSWSARHVYRWVRARRVHGRLAAPIGTRLVKRVSDASTDPETFSNRVSRARPDKG
jgi:hypothetical protein